MGQQCSSWHEGQSSPRLIHRNRHGLTLAVRPARVSVAVKWVRTACPGGCDNGQLTSSHRLRDEIRPIRAIDSCVRSYRVTLSRKIPLLARGRTDSGTLRLDAILMIQFVWSPAKDWRPLWSSIRPNVRSRVFSSFSAAPLTASSRDVASWLTVMGC